MEKINIEDKLFTDKEAARILKVHVTTLWRERKKGNIGFRRVTGRRIMYSRHDLETYLNKDIHEPKTNA